MGLTQNLGLLSTAIKATSTLNVGIGTSSPTSKLHIYNSGADVISTLETTTGYSTYNRNKNGNRSWVSGLDGGSSSWLILDETANAIRLAITSGGNVGIGTNSPDSYANRTLQLHNASTGSTYFKISNSTTGSSQGDGLDIGEINSDTYIWNRENGFMSFGTNGTERLLITASGLNTFIGKNAIGNFQLSVDDFGNYNFNNAIAGGYRNYLNYAAAIFMITSNNGTSGMFMSSGGSSWNVFSSDVRVKKNFEPSQGLAELLQIEAVKYHMKTDSDDAPKRLGFKAQNLLPLIPEMVTTNPMALDDDGKPLYTITPDYLLPVLVKAIQELKAEIDALKNK